MILVWHWDIWNWPEKKVCLNGVEVYYRIGPLTIIIYRY